MKKVVYAALCSLLIFVGVTLSAQPRKGVSFSAYVEPWKTETVSAGTREDSIAFMNATWQRSYLKRKATISYTQVKMFGGIQSISVIRYPAHRFRTKVAVGMGNGAAMTTSNMGKVHKGKFAVNGNYFNVKALTPITYVKIGKNIYSRTVPSELFRTNGLMKVRCCGHRVDISLCDTAFYDKASKGWKYAIAAGPMLIENGSVVAYDAMNNADPGFYLHRHPRSFIGYDSKGNVYMAVIDGRAKDNADGASIAETAYIAHLLGLTDAINLDGGGSSTLWADPDFVSDGTMEGVINNPCDNKKFDHAGERVVPDIIYVK